MSITFYAYPQSSSSPVACALLELGVPHERVTVDIRAGEQHKPWYLALNPNGKVPTLVVDGTPMFEALAIQQWLGDRYGVAKGSWPAADAPARLEALSWTTWGYVTYGAALQRLLYSTSEFFPKELHHPPLARAAQQELQQLLGVLDGRLSQRPYLLGKDFSLADLTLFSVIRFGDSVGAKTAEHSAVRAWMARCAVRPSLQDAVT
jgi:glutathione S-transferase